MSGSPQAVLPCLLISFEVLLKWDKSSVVGDKDIDLATDLALMSQFGVEINRT